MSFNGIDLGELMLLNCGNGKDSFLKKKKFNLIKKIFFHLFLQVGG